MTQRTETVDTGCYVAVFHLARPRQLQIGRLGRFRFPAGFYLYVGSARRGLTRRLERHARRSKPLHWHIDYLSARARMAGALVVPDANRAECALAAELAAAFEPAAPRFGASDCRCPTHLFFTPRLPG
jgi:sugar fermentation stimulation protein A